MVYFSPFAHFQCSYQSEVIYALAGHLLFLLNYFFYPYLSSPAEVFR